MGRSGDEGDGGRSGDVRDEREVWVCEGWREEWRC